MKQKFPFNVMHWTGSQEHPSNLRAGTHFHFDLDAVNRFCLDDLPPRLVDLLRIASAVYVVDRLVRRRRANPTRTIGLKVEVLDHSFWSDGEVRDAVGKTIDFVSGDYWDIEFICDASPFSRTRRLLPDSSESPSPLVVLYSGGLDSAAGLATRIADDPSRPVIPVSVWHQPRQRALLKAQYKVLRSCFAAQIAHLIMKVAVIRSSDVVTCREERSQRCRSFLFAALGAVAAIMHGQKRIELFESGVGAINLPLLSGMVGSRTTKSCHPQFLRLMSRLVSIVAEDEVEFRLPFFDQTKGEVVTKLHDLNLHELARMTCSCTGFPLRHPQAKQCGVCAACLFRRQAMRVAGISESSESYKYDIFNAMQMQSAQQKRLKCLKAFLMQVAKLDGAETQNRLPSSFERHVLSTEIVQRGQSQQGLIDLLARYRNEWLAIAADAQRNHLPWSSWLARPTRAQRAEGVPHVSAS